MIITVLFFCSLNTFAQELFVISEPASNIPAKSISMRLTNKIMNGNRHHVSGIGTKNWMQRIVPEINFGINKKVNVKLSAYVANYYQDKMKLEGFNINTKYRFFSRDDVHKHFRMAAFTRVSVIDHGIHFREINLEGDNSGINSGVIATQLLHKLAVSATIGHVYVFDNLGYERPEFVAQNSLNYTISAGYLLFPIKYKNYLQPNINLYLEFQGRNGISAFESHIYDVFPAVQIILKSYMRIDLGYRYQIKSNVQRNAYSSYLIRFEYNMFNAMK
jgi:hypothetical protein